MTTRSMAMEKSTATMVSAVIKDILTDPRFESVVAGHIEKRLLDIKEELQTQEARILDLESTSKSKSAEIESLRSQLETRTNALNALNNRLEGLEQYSRRNSLRFFGIKESPGENTDDIIIKLATDNLKMNLRKEDIDRSHRIGPPKESTSENTKPRAIIVKFASYRKRREVIGNRRKLAGKRMSILEDLTAKNAVLLNAARLSPKVKSAWSIDGRIFALPNTAGSVKKLLTCKEDINKL
ncbi:uncharacterized protein LOC129277668 [Lytechinus pictus]|uniref:uncharacterized protein LOC129277668 n=1 Tax=Lytechinus pictus TaxID=7653 RepID=UPI0030BA0FB2